MGTKHNFRVGDIVIVNSRVYRCMDGSVGIIAAIDGYGFGNSPDYGLDFSCGTFVCSDEYVNLHDLAGRLPAPTGWWVGGEDIEYFCQDDDRDYSLENLESIFA